MNSLWGALIFFALLLLLQNMLANPSAQQLPYSEFKAALRQGRIQRVQIGKHTIRGTRLLPREPRPYDSTEDASAMRSVRFTTVRVDDPELIRELETHQIPYKGQYEHDGWNNLLSWLLPIALMVALWSFLLRRMGAGGQGLLNFGKSRARIYAEQETGVSFADVAGVDEAKDNSKKSSIFSGSRRSTPRSEDASPKASCWSGLPARAKRF
jgi:cell division protease FtsH